MVALAAVDAAGICALPQGVRPDRKNWLASAVAISCAGVGSPGLLALEARGKAQAMLPGSFKLVLNVSLHKKLVLQTNTWDWCWSMCMQAAALLLADLSTLYGRHS